MAAQVVILGGGFAGVSTARELERKSAGTVEVTLVSRENYFLFTPMLPEVACGSIEMRHIVQPLRLALPRTTFVLGDAQDIDLHARTLAIEHPILRTRSTHAFDHLVLALGSVTSTFGLPGVEQHTLPLKTLFDAAQVRNRVIEAFEAAAGANSRVQRDRFLRFVIVGGGFTGVETAGELTGFIRRIRRYYHVLDGYTPEIVVIEAAKHLLSELPERFGKRAAASLARREVILELGEDVASADEHGIALKGGKRYESATIIWSAGVEAAPVVKKAGLKTSKHGAVVVNGNFSVPGLSGVWGVGDCAQIPQRKGGSYAPLAQNAVREGPLLARNILASLHGKTTRTFGYRRFGMMASLGDRDAVAELPGKRMIAGMPAWLLWRGYYFSRLPGLSRKIRVGLDWTLGGIFRQPIARLALVSDDSVRSEKHAS